MKKVVAVAALLLSLPAGVALATPASAEIEVQITDVCIEAGVTGVGNVAVGVCVNGSTSLD